MTALRAVFLFALSLLDKNKNLVYEPIISQDSCFVKYKFSRFLF